MITIILDVLLAVLLVNSMISLIRGSGGVMPARCFIILGSLLLTHVTGNTLQELEIGPIWVQDHMHDIGVAVFSWLVAFIGLTLAEEVRIKRYGGRFYISPMRFIRVATLYFLLATVFFIGTEIYEVMFEQERLISRGYSGELDINDTISYLIGAILITGNYLVFFPRIRHEEWRKRAR